MIVILSPAKTIIMNRDGNTKLHTMPVFLEEAEVLMKELLKYSPPELEALMKINSALAEKNFFRHVTWNKTHTLDNSRQAILAYDGAVYKGINAETLNEKQLIFANEHLRILSGLYGVLQPLDLIMPYRLEMETKLKNELGNDLYCFWKEKLTENIKAELKNQNDNILIDLASKEYSSAIDTDKANAKVIKPVFKDYKNGTYKNITIYTKRARGLMARFIVDNNIVKPEELKEFNEEGYSYDEYMSAENLLVFTR